MCNICAIRKAYIQIELWISVMQFFICRNRGNAIHNKIKVTMHRTKQSYSTFLFCFSFHESICVLLIACFPRGKYIFFFTGKHTTSSYKHSHLFCTRKTWIEKGLTQGYRKTAKQRKTSLSQLSKHCPRKTNNSPL